MPPKPAPPIPTLFLQRMKRLLGDEYAAFAAALEDKPVSGLRVNTLKLSAAQFQTITPYPIGDPVAWCDSAFIIPTSDFSFGKHPYHLAGLYYLQDPSAMSAATLLDPQPGERVLDLAAAPGGKTTALAARMQGEGLLVANEIKDKRLGHLAVNVERWGAGNVVITNETPERLADTFGAFFDRVLVDAPCSGEGMFRKDGSARLDWSPQMVEGCAERQRNILRVAARLVKPSGYLLYSTCTFAPEEDEAIINGLIDPRGSGMDGFTNRAGSVQFEVVALPQLPGFMPGRPEWLASNAKGKGLEGAVRLFPHRVSGEGHFACLLKRSGTADGNAEGIPDRLASPSRAQERLWQAFAGEVLKVDFAAARLRVRAERLYYVPEKMTGLGNLRVVHPGVWLGTFKKERFEPAHPLAMFLQHGQALNGLDLPAKSREIAAYIHGETIASDGPPGWMLVSVDGWPLGWGKRVQGIIKNHYPKGWQVYS
jgi:NOL1/NOP2/sun family putative RNA methylase